MNDAKRLWFIDNQIVINEHEKYSDLRRDLNSKKDASGVLRSYSRLKNATVPFEMKVPVFIDRDHKLAELIVNYCHHKVLHCGIKQTLTELRSTFWITRGRSYVKKWLRHVLFVIDLMQDPMNTLISRICPS